MEGETKSLLMLSYSGLGYVQENIRVDRRIQHSQLKFYERMECIERVYSPGSRPWTDLEDQNRTEVLKVERSMHVRLTR